MNEYNSKNYSMDEHADHHHTPQATKDNIKALKITAWLTGVYFFIELGIGIYTGSIAVLSDAFHTFSAVGGVILALIAGRIAMKPANQYRTFGLFRAEIMGALFNGFFLLIMAFIVLWMGYNRLLNPIYLSTTPMLLAAFGGLITEFIAIRLLYKSQKDDLNMKGAFWHIMQTFVGSFIIIITAIVIKFTDFLIIDPLLGMIFGATLIYASWGIIRESIEVLLETVPKDVDLDEVKRSLEKLEGIKDVHHIHAWAITSGKNIFSTHIRVDNLDMYDEIMKQAHKILKNKYNFYFSTVQIEKDCTDEGEASDIDVTS